MSRKLAPVLTLFLFVSGIALVSTAAAEAPDPGEAVRTAILRLPYYGPFDLISFQETDGVVTLGGEVYVAVLKREAEAAVRGVAGVRDVVNRIEVLPVSFEDDRLRQTLFGRIYTDDFLSKYGTPMGLIGARPWGRGFRSRAAFAGASWRGAPFFGLEPAGRYAIHLIVKGGRVTLYGDVDNATDRRKAELVAQGVFGVHGVENEIVVRTDTMAPPADGKKVPASSSAGQRSGT